MEYKLNFPRSNSNNKNKYILEEDKNIINTRNRKRYNYFLNNINFTSKNNKLYNDFKENLTNDKINYMNDKKTIFQNYYDFNKFFKKKEPNNNKNNIITIKKIDRSSSVSDLLNIRKKKLIVFKGLNKNNSSAELINKNTISVLPLIKPRKIIIDICSGPHELRITNLNNNDLNKKQYGHNSIFMGEKYNPDNYEIKKINKFNRNYHGKLFSN